MFAVSCDMRVVAMKVVTVESISNVDEGLRIEQEAQSDIIEEMLQWRQLGQDTSKTKTQLK